MESTHNVTYLANGYQNDTQQKVEEKRYAVKAAQASARLHSYYNASDPVSLFHFIIWQVWTVKPLYKLKALTPYKGVRDGLILSKIA